MTICMEDLLSGHKRSMMIWSKSDSLILRKYFGTMQSTKETTGDKAVYDIIEFSTGSESSSD